MPTTIVVYTLVSTGRTNIKNEVIELFKQESPGTGTGSQTSKYIYTVESYLNYNIVLNRPARFNKGFDFLIRVKAPNNAKIFNSKSGKTNEESPTHDNIINSLISARNSNNQNYDLLIKPLIINLFAGNNIIINTTNLPFVHVDPKGNHHPIEIILLVIKWLFIEQDITYWNWSGRQMLYNSLAANNLV